MDIGNWILKSRLFDDSCCRWNVWKARLTSISILTIATAAADKKINVQRLDLMKAEIMINIAINHFWHHQNQATDNNSFSRDNNNNNNGRRNFTDNETRIPLLASRSWSFWPPPPPPQSYILSLFC